MKLQRLFKQHIWRCTRKSISIVDYSYLHKTFPLCCLKVVKKTNNHMEFVCYIESSAWCQIQTNIFLFHTFPKSVTYFWKLQKTREREKISEWNENWFFTIDFVPNFVSFVFLLQGSESSRLLRNRLDLLANCLTFSLQLNAEIHLWR